MKKYLLLLLLLPFAANAALTTVPWRYDTTANTYYTYPNVTGNVGIGSTSPTSILGVNPIAGVSPFAVGSSTASLLYINPNGAVFVGSTTKLVAGSGWLATTPGNLQVANNLGVLGFVEADNGYNVGGTSVISSASNLVNLGGVIRAASTKGLAFQTNAANITYLTITPGGYIGIGTTTPLLGFEVASNTPQIGITNPGAGLNLKHWGIFGDGLGSLNFGTSSDAGATSTPYALTITNAGNVGIGTNTPSALLSINPNGISGPAFAIGSSTKTLFVVDNAGHVGINTATPAFSLDVNGLSEFRSTLNVSASGISSNALTNLSLYANNQTNLGITVQSGTGNVGIGTSSPLAALDVAGANNGTAPLFQLSSVSSFATTTRFFVTNAGNVGIGTTTPDAKLTILPTVSDVVGVNDAISIGDGAGREFGLRLTSANRDLALDYEQGGTWAAALTVARATGNVGIGTTTPNAKLTIAGAGASGALNLDADTGSPTVSARLFFSNATPGQSFALLNTGGDLIFGSGATAGATSGTERVRFASNGNVGIGTSSPLAALDVAGANNGTAPLFQLSSVSSFATTTRFFVTNAGNVGIGTTSPTAVLVTVAASSTVATGAYTGLVSIIAGFENTTLKLFQEIDQWGHLITSGDTPTITGGTSTIAGNDQNGTVTVTGSLLTSVTLTFAHPYLTAPDCTESDNSTAITADISSISTTQVVFGFSTGINSGTVWYRCAAHQ